MKKIIFCGIFIIISIFLLLGCSNTTEDNDAVSVIDLYKTAAKSFIDSGDTESAIAVLEEGIALSDNEELRIMLSELAEVNEEPSGYNGTVIDDSDEQNGILDNISEDIDTAITVPVEGIPATNDETQNAMWSSESSDDWYMERDTTDSVSSYSNYAVINDGMNEIDGILNGTVNIVDYVSGIETTIFFLPTVNDSYSPGCTPVRYSIADITQDGFFELFIEYSDFGDTAVIHKYGDDWVANYAAYREILNLTSSGTSSFSNSATNSGIQKIHFLDGRMVNLTILESDTADPSNPVYYINGALAAEEQYNSAFQKEASAEPLVWINY